MTQLLAFTKKELLEQLRSGKLLLLFIIFCMFGIMNPAIAKLTPWMMELMSGQLAESGMFIKEVKVNALTSWTQFYKNLPIALIICIVLFSGIVTAEYQKGTLINLITKGMKRWKILVSKLTVITFFWTAGYAVIYAITYGYSAYFWDNSIVKNLGFGAVCFWLMGLWILTVILPASVCFRSASAVTLTSGAAFLASYLLGLFPAVKKYVPTHLMESAALMTGKKSVEEYAAAIVVTVILIAVNAAVSVILFNRKNL